MRRGHVTIGPSTVGSFDVEEDTIIVHFNADAVVQMNKKFSIILTDGCTLEEAIERVSVYGLVLGLRYPSVYAAGDVGKSNSLEDHKA